MAAFPPPLLLLLLFLFPQITESSDAEALLAFKLAVDPHDSLPWRRATIADLCSPSWPGVRECSSEGRVTKLVLEFLNLTGVIPIDALTPLAELRVLSLKSNSLSGQIPDLSHLSNLKSLYLNFNRFSGHIPSEIAALHRLKVVVLSDNLLSGDIPPSLTSIPRLYVMLLQNKPSLRNDPAVQPIEPPVLQRLRQCPLRQCPLRRDSGHSVPLQIQSLLLQQP